MMIDKDDPIIKEWKNGIPFDENGEVIRGVRLTEEELKEALESIDALPVDPDNDVKQRPWMRHAWW